MEIEDLLSKIVTLEGVVEKQKQKIVELNEQIAFKKGEVWANHLTIEKLAGNLNALVTDMSRRRP